MDIRKSPVRIWSKVFRMAFHPQCNLPNTSLWFAATSLAVLSTAFTVYGQTPTPAAPASTPTLSVNASEVSLDLVVHDDKGRPVLDLKPSDIAVSDNGTPVKITNLRLVKDDPANGRKVTLVFNRLDSAGNKNARDVAGKMLKAIPEGTSFAVMNVGSRLRLLQMFTTDRAAVERGINLATVDEKIGVPGTNVAPEKNLLAVAQTGADSAGVAVPMTERATAKVLLASLQESQRIVQDHNSQPPMAALLALANSERDITGRKVVIYFTEGLQMDSNAADMIRNIVGAANRSGITIYAVDLNALDSQSSNQMMATMAMGAQGPSLGSAAHAATAPVEGAVGSSVGPGTFTADTQLAGRIETDQGVQGATPLGSIAIGTGGAYMVAGDNLKKPLKAMVDDMTNYYEASFVPAISDYDGSYRSVHVTALRKNLSLRYRAGYFALAPGSDSTVRPFEAPLLKILAGAELPNDLQFHAGVLRMGNLQEGNENTIAVEAPIDGLEVREDANTKLYSLHVSIVAQIKNKDGVVIDHFSEDIPRHGALESLEGMRNEVITLQRHFVAPPGDYTLEAAILDHNSEKAGAQRSKFTIPEPGAGLSMSDVALVRRTDLFHTDADPTEPLRYGKARVVPNLSGEVSRESKEVSIFFIIHPEAAASPVKLEMQVMKEGKQIGKMQLPVRADLGASVAVPYLSTIGAKSLSPGHYEVAAVLTQNGKSVEHSATFTIVGGEVASASVPRPGIAGAAAGTDAEPVSDTLPGIGAREASHLSITTPTEAVPPPSPEAIATILAGARARALHYSESLPNFSCVEMTTRSTDPSGRGDWKHKDSMAQLLKFHDNAETRSILEVDGRHTKVEPEDRKGMTSRGQFGGVLNAVFAPDSKADFQWKETDMLGTGIAQVFSYKVEQKNSNYGLTGHNMNQINVAFHGLVYIDASTLGVRRITLEADGIPRDFSIHASAIAVDYDYIMINNHDYLMPVHAAVSIRQGKHEGVLNEMDFRDYKRFGSRVRILGAAAPPSKP